MHNTTSYREAINSALIQEMKRNKNIFLYGLDVTDHKRLFGSTANLVEEFGSNRCFGIPLSEDAMTGFGIGAAIAGLRPVYVHIRADFLFLCMNQLANMLSSYRYLTGGKVTIPIVIRAVMGRGWGQGAQHSKSIHSILAHLPGLSVVMPAHPADAKGLLVSALRGHNPVVVLEHRWLYDTLGNVPNSKDFSVPIGEPNILKSGKDITILTTSWMTIEGLKSAELLKKHHGVEAEIIDVRTIAPLNYQKIYNSVFKTRRCVVVDYDWLEFGFSAEASTNIYANCFQKLKSPVERLGFAFTPCPTTQPLEDAFYPTATSIIRKVETMLKLKKSNLTNEIFYDYKNKFKGPF